ncbi:hypothetical protein CVT24_011906 [Panaeolus cyanescens]|uniref:Uncharacterized protein n=1 Tax=Panaeolus cyanescens TaxID=181874 RepID=A0A409YNP1_9AGAR|nr:hypothetical protein CVT24_011906 [Panaeolus cyanescens]
MSKRNKTGAAAAKRPVPLSPSDDGRTSISQRQQTPTKKMKHAYEQELTFTTIHDRNATPERAPTDDDELPSSVLQGDSRVGSRVTRANSQESAVKCETGTDTEDSNDEGSGDDYSDGRGRREQISDSRDEYSQSSSDRRTPYDNDSANEVEPSHGDHHRSHQHADRRGRRQEEPSDLGDRRDLRDNRPGGEADSQDFRRRAAAGSDQATHEGSRHASRDYQAPAKPTKHGEVLDAERKADHRAGRSIDKHTASQTDKKDRRERGGDRYAADARGHKGGRHGQGVGESAKGQEGMFATAEEARRDKSKFLSDNQHSSEASRRRSRNASPTRSARGRSAERRSDVADGITRASRQARLDAAVLKEKERQAKAAANDAKGAGPHKGGKQVVSKDPGPASRNYTPAPEWSANDDTPLIFNMDLDTQHEAAGDDAAKHENAKAVPDADDGKDAKGKGRVANQAQAGTAPSFQLDDYDDAVLPELGLCEMRASFTNSNQAHVTPYFLDLCLVGEDLQEEEMRMIESAHLFKQSVPYANIAKMEPGAFDLDAPYYRLVWNNNWVLGTEPSMVSQRSRNVVGIQVGIVRRPHLKKAVNLSTHGTYLARRLGILPTEMSLKRMVRLMGTKLGRSALKLSIDDGCIINHSVKGGSTGTPAKSRYTRAAVSKTTDPSVKEKGDIEAGFYPSVLEYTATVKVYDARNTGFRFDKAHLDKVHELPEYATFTEDSELNTRCVVAAFYTLNAYGIPKEPVDEENMYKECPTVSSNIQFAIVLAALPFDM